MSGSQISSEGLDVRRRRLLVRAWRRGMREMDLVLGPFADAKLAGLTEDELTEFEKVLDIPDQKMFAWLNGSETTPPEVDTALFRKIREFHRH
jgi:antitoxin CptB